MNREIEYIQKQLAKAQMAKKHLPMNAPKKQKEDLQEKIKMLENILKALEGVKKNAIN